MEHHLLWHIGAASLGDRRTHIHEAVHGWFGAGVRLACWEDLVLSEGTATYYEARILEAVAGAEAGQAARAPCVFFAGPVYVRGVHWNNL